MPKIPSIYLEYDELPASNKDEKEPARPIDQYQLSKARVFSGREEYIKTLPPSIKYMEIGVAWGYYSELVCQHASPSEIVLVDPFNNDLKCWSWRKFGECKCTNMKHELLFTPETNEQYIVNLFSKYGNVRTIKGFAPEVLPNENEYDYIYIDMTNDRIQIREVLKKVSRMLKPGGVVGLNDYVIYDGVIEDIFYGTFQAVNEFLYFNKDWSVDAIALHPLGFNDIYLRKPS
jgi:predicted methyltransferase